MYTIIHPVIKFSNKVNTLIEILNISQRELNSLLLKYNSFLLDEIFFNKECNRDIKKEFFILRKKGFHINTINLKDTFYLTFTASDKKVYTLSQLVLCDLISVDLYKSIIASIHKNFSDKYKVTETIICFEKYEQVNDFVRYLNKTYNTKFYITNA
jgi:hypothetical protein